MFFLYLLFSYLEAEYMFWIILLILLIGIIWFIYVTFRNPKTKKEPEPHEVSSPERTTSDFSNAYPIKEEPEPRSAISWRMSLDPYSADTLREHFIAFDVETTGLSPTSDRIVELGAVLFENGEVSKTFSSLVNPGIPIPRAASAVNHITNSMLSNAPSEEEIYPQLLDFLGEAIRSTTSSDTIAMCAHNADFDFKFLSNTLSRLGISASMKYIDTLRLSREYLHGLPNYKQSTLEAHFGLTNPEAHRAVHDAENCGRILIHLLDAADESLNALRRQDRIQNKKREMRKKQAKRIDLTPQELEVCAYIQNVIREKGGDTQWLRFEKNGNCIAVTYPLEPFLKFKILKKGSCLLVKSNCPIIADYHTEPCTATEGDSDYLRVFFSSPFELEALSEYIYKEFSDQPKEDEEVIRELEDDIRLMPTLTDEEVSALLTEVKARDEVLAEEARQKAAEKARLDAEKAAKASAAKAPGKRAVFQLDKEGNVIKEFSSIVDAAREVGVDPKGIRDTAKGVRKTAGGYRWMYKE